MVPDLIRLTTPVVESEETSVPETMKPPLLWRWMCPLLLLLLAGLDFYLMRPDVAGMLYDDGMYLIAGKHWPKGMATD